MPLTSGNLPANVHRETETGMDLDFTFTLFSQAAAMPTAEEIADLVAERISDDIDQMRALILLIGVVVGLSVGRFVSFVGQLIVDRHRIRISLTFGIFLLSLFLYQVYYWWSLWELNSLQDVSFLAFFRLLIIPLCLYGATAILTPDVKDTRPDDFSLEDHLHKQSQALCVLLFVLVLTGLSQGVFLFQQEGMRNWLRIAGLVILLPGIFWRSRIYIRILSILVLGLVGFYVWIAISS